MSRGFGYVHFKESKSAILALETETNFPNGKFKVSRFNLEIKDSNAKAKVTSYTPGNKNSKEKAVNVNKDKGKPTEKVKAQKPDTQCAKAELQKSYPIEPVGAEEYSNGYWNGYGYNGLSQGNVYNQQQNNSMYGYQDLFYDNTYANYYDGGYNNGQQAHDYNFNHNGYGQHQNYQQNYYESNPYEVAFANNVYGFDNNERFGYNHQQYYEDNLFALSEADYRSSQVHSHYQDSCKDYSNSGSKGKSNEELYFFLDDHGSNENYYNEVQYNNPEKNNFSVKYQQEENSNSEQGFRFERFKNKGNYELEDLTRKFSGLQILE